MPDYPQAATQRWLLYFFIKVITQKMYLYRNYKLIMIAINTKISTYFNLDSVGYGKA